MIVSYNNNTKTIFCISSFAEKDIPKSAGFRWFPKDKQWQTPDIDKAEKLSQYFDTNTRNKVDQLKGVTKSTEILSSALSSDITIPCPTGLEYMAFQKAGIEYGVKHQHVLIADEQGVGKTIEAIGITNLLTPNYVLVLCPSTPKINWSREYKKWSIYNKRIAVIKDEWVDADVVIINYDKLEKFSGISDIVLEEIATEHFLEEYLNGQHRKFINKDLRLFNEIVKVEVLNDIESSISRLNKKYEKSKDESILSEITILAKNKIDKEKEFKDNWLEIIKTLNSKIIKNTFNRLISISDLKDIVSSNKGLSSVKKKSPTNKQIMTNKEFILKLYPKTLSEMNFRNYFTEKTWDIIFCDEAHRIKNPKTIRYKCLKDIEAKKKIALTGTPIKIRPISIWNILKWLEQDWASNWIDFVTKYCNGQMDRFGKWKVDGSSNEEELNNKLRSTCMIRRMKSEVMKELPPKTRQIVEIESESFLDLLKEEKDLVKIAKSKIRELKAQRDMTPDGTKEYSQIADKLKECRLEQFNNISKARHAIAVKKIPYVIEHISDLSESVNKIVLFAHHRDVIDSLEKQLTELGLKCVTLVGGMTDEKKQVVIDSFQQDSSVNMFIGSIMACGEAITLTSAYTCLFAELDWDVGAITQCEDRLHRKTQENNVLIQHLVVNGSIDARMVKKMIKSQIIIDKALNKPDISIEENWEDTIDEPINDEIPF